MQTLRSQKMKQHKKYYDLYEEQPYKGFRRGNLENRISMIVLWIYLVIFGLMFTRGLILFLNR